MSVTITYLGGFASKVAVNEEVAYVIDPWKPEHVAVETGYVLITHLTPAIIEALKSCTKPVVMCAAVAEVLTGNYPELAKQLDITTYDVGQQDNYPHGLLSLVVAPRKDKEPSCGFILEMEGNQVYHAGPAQFDQELRDIGRAFKPNLSMLAMSKNHLTDEQMVQVPMWLGSDIIMPMSTWETPDDEVDMGEVFQAVDIYSPAICRILNPGESYTLEKIEDSGRTVGPESRY